MGAERAPELTESDTIQQPTTPPKFTVLDGGANAKAAAPTAESAMTDDEMMEKARTLLADAGHDDRVTDDEFVRNFSHAYFYHSPEVDPKDPFPIALKYAELKTSVK